MHFRHDLHSTTSLVRSYHVLDPDLQADPFLEAIQLYLGRLERTSILQRWLQADS